jgi:hypothetical protein
MVERKRRESGGGETLGARRRRFAEYLRAHLTARGVSLARASVAMGRDPAFLSQVLDPKRNRHLPSPDELKLLAAFLEVPLGGLLEACWGIDMDAARREVQAMLAQRTNAIDLSDLSPESQRAVAEFVGYLKAKAAAERRTRSNGGDGE